MPGFCGFDNDVFISYAHADNALGWVAAFETHLNARLNELRRDAGFAVWRDPRLGGTYVLTDEITARLKSCGVLISILSPNGLDSDWCQRERTLFEQFAARNGGFVLNNKARALRITKSPCANNKDRALFGAVGHDFYTGDPPSFTETDQASPEFRAALLTIAQEVFDLLTDLRQKRATEAAAPTLTVYLTAAPPNTPAARWRARLANELTGARNCRVLPEDPDPDNLSKAATNAFLKDCDLSVHWATASLASTDHLQFECALALPVQRIVFEVAPPGQPAPSPDVLSAKPTASSHFRDERPRASAPDEVIQFFEELIKARQKTTPAAPSSSPIETSLVYVVCAPGEMDDALVLKQCIEAEPGYSVILPPTNTDDGSTLLKDLRDWLDMCHAAVLFWGSASETVFRDEQRHVIAALTRRKGQAFTAFCLASCTTANPAIHNLPILPLERIPSSDCAYIRPHVNKLKSQKAEGATAR